MIPAKIDVDNSLVLGIDCSGESFSVAVVKDGRCLAEHGGFCPRSHLRRLFPAIKHCIEDAGASFKSLAAVGVTAGPGSFTGLRLGIVTARTIAQATGCSLAAVNTLDAIAAAHPGCSCLMAGLDARRGEVFGAFFDTSDGTLRRLAEDKAYSPEELASEMERRGCLLAVGSGAVRYASVFKNCLPGLPVISEAAAQVRGLNVALIGEKLWKSGEVKAISELAPVYLRSADVMVS